MPDTKFSTIVEKQLGYPPRGGYNGVNTVFKEGNGARKLPLALRKALG